MRIPQPKDLLRHPNNAVEGVTVDEIVRPVQYVDTGWIVESSDGRYYRVEWWRYDAKRDHNLWNVTV